MISADSESETQSDLADIYHGILRDDKSLLEQGVLNRVNINTTFKGDSNLQHIGMTPLSLAAALNKIVALKFLLENGANINDTFASLRTTALMTASFHGHARIVDTLLRGGANVQAIDLQGSTALGYAFGGSRSVEVIEMLLVSGININQKNMLGMNALLLVAGYGDDRLVRMVLDAGADPNSTNDFGHSALHLVIVGKRSQLKKLAQDGAGDKVTLDNFNNLKSAEVALKDWAARNKKVTVDSRKLEKAASLMSNIGNKLQKNVIKSSDDSEQEVIKQRVEAVWLHRQEKLMSNKKSLKRSGRLESLLTCRGSKKSKGGDDDQPYLSFPSRSHKRMNTERDKEVVDLRVRFSRILMMIADAGCDVGTTEKTFGMTALDMAILLEDVESTGLLTARGADPEHLLKMFALSDLHEAIVTGDRRMVEKLLCYDVDLDINHHFSTFNVDAKQDDNEDDAGEFILSDGVTPLAVAVQISEDDGNACKIAKILIKNKAEVNKTGPGGTSALTEACRVGNVKMVQMLISYGADVDLPAPRYNEATPVIIATIFNRNEIAQLLADKVAKLDLQTTDGRCALTEAYRNDNIKIVETILRSSLAQAFSDKTSFTYDMVVRFQRPDKTDVNVIMNFLREEVKRQDEDRRLRESAARKKQTASFMRQISEPSSTPQGKPSGQFEESEPSNRATDSRQSNTVAPSTIFSESSLLDDSPKRRITVSEAGEFTPKIQNAPKSLISKVESSFPSFTNSLEAHESALASTIGSGLDKGAKQMKHNFEDGVSRIQSSFNEAVRKPVQHTFDNFSIRQTPSPGNSHDASSSSKRGIAVEDWEDVTGFKEQYYPAPGLKNGEPCLMTTPILGRCTQVRQNFAQADTYLKDVVKTGNLRKLSRSAIRTIDDEDEDDDKYESKSDGKRSETDI